MQLRLALAATPVAREKPLIDATGVAARAKR